MTPEEIIAYDLKNNTKSKEPLEKVIAGLNQAMKQGVKVMRQGNTLMMFKKKTNDVVEFHTFNAAHTEELITNIKKLMQLFKKLGFKKAVTTYDKPEITKLFEANKGSYPVTISSKNGLYQAEVSL